MHVVTICHVLPGTSLTNGSYSIFCFHGYGYQSASGKDRQYAALGPLHATLHVTSVDISV